MGKVVNSIVELIGNTPLVEVKGYSEQQKVEARILVKLESFNPLSSIKDRIAAAMIAQAEEEGLLKKDSVIIEPTSGNTGIGLAAVAAAKGYKIILTMPETMSVERRNLLRALGAELVLTEGAKGMKGAIQKAEELVKETPNGFMPSQFENLANPQVHRQTTAQEILRDTDGVLDVFVAGIGTGGTITGVGEVLKTAHPEVKIVGVEPEASPFLSQGIAGPHKIQGIGAGFKPAILNTAIIDLYKTVSNEDAIATARVLAKTEGILSGVSSGAALYAATQLAKEEAYKGKTIVVILPDTGERYLSTGLFE